MAKEDGSTRRSCQRAAALLGAFFLPCVVHAHARPLSLTQILVHPTEPGRIVGVGTWGLALTQDDGAEWTWLCAAAFGVDPRFEDPPSALTADGRLLQATYLGLHQAAGPVPCEVEVPPGRLGEGFVIDLSATADGARAFALLSDLNDDDILFQSGEVPGTWEELHRNFDLLLDRVRVAPNDPSHVYMSAGMIRFAGEPYQTFLLASEDGGRSFERHEFALEESENLLKLTAVSPVDPRQLFGEVIGFRGEAALERIVRSDDGGRNWRTVLEAPDARSIAISEDGTLVFVGSTLGGLWRSLDGGQNFSLIQPEIHVRCLTWHEGTLYLCTNPDLDGFGMGVSTDRGDNIVARLRFRDISGMANCPSCSPAGFVCPAWTGDVVYDLQLDAALPEGFDPDAGTGAPRDLGPAPPACEKPDLGGEAEMDASADADAGGRTDLASTNAGSDGCGCQVSAKAPTSQIWVLLGLASFVCFRRRLRRTAA